MANDIKCNKILYEILILEKELKNETNKDQKQKLLDKISSMEKELSKISKSY